MLLLAQLETDTLLTQSAGEPKPELDASTGSSATVGTLGGERRVTCATCWVLICATLRAGVSPTQSLHKSTA